jgi:SGNH domain (fused to AT3 domains)
VKLLYITKTSCPAQSVSVRVWERDIPYGACDVWRKHAITLINKLKHVDLIVLGGYAHHQITRRYTNSRINNPTARATEWRAGTRRTVKALRGVADEIVILRDTPLMRVDSAPCLLATGGNNHACQTSYSRASADLLWRSEKQVAGEYGHVAVADFTSAFCTPSRCRPVTSTRVLRWRDQSHMTVTFSRLLAPRVRLMIRQGLGGRLSG